MAFSENIRLLREKRGLSQEQLADCLGIPRSTITHYESQTNERLPRMDRLQVIADFFGVSIDQLVSTTMNEVQTWEQLKDKPISKGLPILGTIRAGIPILAQENIEGYLDLPDNLCADYALQVVGDSMIGAGILDGDLAICRQAEMAQSGQIVVAIKDLATGFSEATLKYYFEGNGDGPELRPANPSYSELHMKDGYRIAGVMVALIRKDTPSYQVYKDYLAVNDQDEWTETIDLAVQSGIKPERLKSFIEMLREMK